MSENGTSKRGRPPFREFRRKHQIKELWGKHHEIKRLHVLGLKNVEIAEMLGISPITVSIVLNSLVMQPELKKLQDARDAATVDIAKDIRATLPAAQGLLRQVLTDPDAPLSLRVKVAMDQLSRAGYVAPTKVEGHLHYSIFTRQEIEDLKKSSLRAAYEAGLITDAEIVEDERPKAAV